MFGMFENLTKAVISVALTPVTTVVDTLMIPVDAESKGSVYSRTVGTIKNAGECLEKATKPE